MKTQLLSFIILLAAALFSAFGIFCYVPWAMYTGMGLAFVGGVVVGGSND